MPVVPTAKVAAATLAQEHPGWQVVVVDLRCHGESARMARRPGAPHTVEAAGGDVLQLLRRLNLFPEVLVGHSFGGKASCLSPHCASSPQTCTHACMLLPNDAGMQSHLVCRCDCTRAVRPH